MGRLAQMDGGLQESEEVGLGGWILKLKMLILFLDLEWRLEAE